jgi:hypothetical protein
MPSSYIILPDGTGNYVWFNVGGITANPVAGGGAAYECDVTVLDDDIALAAAIFALSGVFGSAYTMTDPTGTNTLTVATTIEGPSGTASQSGEFTFNSNTNGLAAYNAAKAAIIANGGSVTTN